MMLTAHCRHLCLMIVVACCPAYVFANALEKQVTDGHLQIRSTLSPSADIVPGQKIALTLEVATDRWFAGGTRISIPEVPGLVILQNEQFASNASESRQGQTWVIQRWTLDVFAQRAGGFTIPPITVRLKVNAGELGDVEGELTSDATRFSAAIPTSLAQAKHWVAAPAFTVEQSFNRDLENLAVGDAFEQEVLFEAADLMAMMLPRYEVAKLQGLAAYPSPAVLDNSNNRGQTRAGRRMSISYVIESPGEFLLPAREYFWWNTDSKELSLVAVPETRIEVAGLSPAQDKTKTLIPFGPGQIAAAVLGLMVLGFLGYLARRLLPHLPITRIKNALLQFHSRVQDLRKPALASQLNPGSNAAD